MPGNYKKKQDSATDKEYLSVDFSSRSISREVNKKTVQKPQVLYPLATGILAAMALLVFEPTVLLLGLAAVGGLAGIGSWFFDSVIRRDSHISEHLKALRKELAAQVKHSIQQLEKELSGHQMEAALSQLHRLKNKFSTFEDMLKSKFNEHEITYERYLGMTEQVFMAGLDNLRKAADISRGLSAINQQHLQKRLLELNQLAETSDAGKNELEALRSRKQLLDTQQIKIQQLLSQNEQAMTQIDKLMAAIASLENTSSKRASMQMEDAMQELSRLAERAKDYQNNL